MHLFKVLNRICVPLVRMAWRGRPCHYPAQQPSVHYPVDHCYNIVTLYSTVAVWECEWVSQCVCDRGSVCVWVSVCDRGSVCVCVYILTGKNKPHLKVCNAICLTSLILRCVYSESSSVWFRPHCHTRWWGVDSRDSLIHIQETLISSQIKLSDVYWLSTLACIQYAVATSWSWLTALNDPHWIYGWLHSQQLLIIIIIIQMPCRCSAIHCQVVASHKSQWQACIMMLWYIYFYWQKSMPHLIYYYSRINWATELNYHIESYFC